MPLPALTPTTFAEALKFAEELAKSTMVPPAFQRNAANILVAVQWGAELGLGPLQALQNIAVINSKPAVYGDAMLALVRGSPLCQDVVEHLEGEGDSRIAICEARRKGAAPVTGRFSVTDAKRAGLWGKAGPWTQYPERMLKMRARGFALRDAFPDVLRGVLSAEEAADTPREMTDVTPPAASIAAELDAFADSMSTTLEDIAPDQAEADELLSEGRTAALRGYAAFREWYLKDIDDDARTALKPHVKGLQESARQIDQAQAPKPRRSRRRDDTPTDADIERQQDMIATVLGPDEVARLEEPPVLVLANPQDWPQAARERLHEMREAGLAPDRYTAFRKANYAALLRLNHEDFATWQEINDIIGESEK